MFRLLKKVWIPLLLVVVVALGGYVVLRVRASFGATATASSAAAATHQLSPNARFYTPPPNTGALTQLKDLVKARDVRDAKLIAQMITTPQAVWFTSGTPAAW